ncbi:MAG: hypothetical protein F6K55_27465 [Moorea sp. SIO4A3]|nr:hypothetical protein [Moorena sp. SIO4A3]
MINTKIFRNGLALLASSLLFTPTAGLASSARQGQVENKLIAAAKYLRNSEYLPTHRPVVNRLSRNQVDAFTLELEAGKSYTLVSFCDDACLDIDLGLYDNNGQTLDYDTDYGQYPIVQVTPRGSGKFMVKVGMPHCVSSSCYYGVGIFAK